LQFGAGGEVVLGGVQKKKIPRLSPGGGTTWVTKLGKKDKEIRVELQITPAGKKVKGKPNGKERNEQPFLNGGPHHKRR